MQKHQRDAIWLRAGFTTALFFSALSGFAQMHIFKRYYIADLPGFGWLAETSYVRLFALRRFEGGRRGGKRGA